MTLDIRWSKEAEFTFEIIVEFIDERWGKASGNKFISKTKKVIQSIIKQPLMFPMAEIDNVRKAVITKQSSVFYEVTETHILLLFFWDNRQDPLYF